MEPHKRRALIISLMLATFLAAVDVTIVETAMPRIVGALDGFHLITWLVTGFLLATTVTVPLWGKLADLIGRKRTFLIGASIFIVGSLLCGLARSMEQLILFRFLQGLGAGAVAPITSTIIADIFPPAERAKIQGLFSAVWGVSGLLGPLLGGIIVDYFTWHWLFFINVPMGAIALFMVMANFDERVVRRETQVDYLGSGLLTASIVLLMLVILRGGSEAAWLSPQIIGMGVGGLALFGLFIWQELRHPDPVLPLDLFKDPLISVSNLINFMLGGVYYGVSFYLPLWAQGVQGYSATRSGASLLWISIGWSGTVSLAGRWLVRVGPKPATLLGLALNTVGAAGLLTLAYLPPTFMQVGLGLVTFIVGCGMGLSTLALTLTVQDQVSWARRGVATASLQFIRTLGGLIWLAVMGSLMNSRLLGGLQAVPELGINTAQEAGEFANALLNYEQIKHLAADVLATVRGALAGALAGPYWLIAICALVGLGITFWLPNRQFEKSAEK